MILPNSIAYHYEYDKENKEHSEIKAVLVLSVIEHAPIASCYKHSYEYEVVFNDKIRRFSDRHIFSSVAEAEFKRDIINVMYHNSDIPEKYLEKKKKEKEE